MTLLNEYDDRMDTPPTDPAKKILFAVLDNILGRRGFRQTWDEVDEEIQEELIRDNLQIVQDNLP